MRSMAAAAMLLALALPAGAEDRPSAPSEAVVAFGASHPDCAEWTDGCVICVRGADAPHCSTPGIACQPGETLCRNSKK
ncbi:hypothetical protein K9U39_05695 [Rhodoblastus acidophilus]|nr:hypothetical protein [Rhodoblastus acidophilus]